MSTTPYEIDPGRPHPLGAVPDAEGVNFSVFSRNATSVELLLFDEHDDRQPAQVVKLDAGANKTFFFWHVYVRGLRPGAHYAYRVDGPDDLHGQGFRFNPRKVLIDPYALGNTDALWNRADACGPDDNLATSMRSVVIDIADYDWEGDRPVNQPMNEMVIYEMHVGGFTRHASSGVAPSRHVLRDHREDTLSEGVGDHGRGTAAGDGVRPQGGAADEAGRGTRYSRSWSAHELLGLQHGQFLRAESSYCVSPEDGAHVREFRDLVKALHRAGIAVILDTVFNHTSEGNHLGPTINYKGFCNEIAYHLSPSDRQYYMDYSGCGNTVNCNHPVVQKFIIECLEFWVKQMHVDGFRFDEGSILSRGEDGVPMAHPPVVWSIELSDALADSKIIAEAWDAAGLYQIGYFPGYRWAEWNGRFRDDVRRFVRGDPGLVGGRGFADRGQLRHLPGQRPSAHQQHQLRDLPRRIHAQRPGIVQRQAQRGQRRGQPRRHQRQPELELRRGRRDRRPGGRGPAEPADPQLRRHLAAGPRSAHGPCGR